MYADYLLKIREEQGVSLRQVSEGVCSESGLSRFENGERVVEKLVRDRITARLGVSNDEFVDYLQPKEYLRYEHRQRIVKAIEEEDLETAKREVEAYAAYPELNGINQQFVEAMRYLIRKLEGAGRDELYDLIYGALALTVSDVEKHFATECLWSPQEFNLLLEQISLEEPGDEVEDVHAWRMAAYERLIAYIDRVYWEVIEEAKVYPRAIYLMFKEFTASQTKDFPVLSNMENFCYLYYENECYNAAEVIETKRKELGLSRVKLGKDICVEKTIARIENQEVNPTIEMMRLLFERLGMYPDYRHDKRQ